MDLSYAVDARPMRVDYCSGSSQGSERQRKPQPDQGPSGTAIVPAQAERPQSNIDQWFTLVGVMQNFLEGRRYGQGR